MKQLKITMETVTPVFLGGADDKTPEWRTPPFRGMMRYWFRALAGGVLGDSNEALKKLREEEAKVFGSPNDRYGQSAVWVRLSAPKFTAKDYPLLPHKNKAYADAIPPSVTITLILTLKPSAEIQKLELAVWSLLVGLALGGIGKRSRRGFGSLRIQAVQELPAELNDALRQQLEQAAQLPATGKVLAQRIGKLLTAARNAFSRFLGGPTPHFTHDLPQFPVLRPDTHIVIWTPDKPLRDHTAALNPLMNKLSNLMHDEGKGNFAQAFGGIRPRRASPLWVSIHPLQNGSWALALTHLKSQYLPKRAGNKHHLVTDFLNAPPVGWTKMEVAQ